MSVQITHPTNFPIGDRPSAAVLPVVAQDPLYDEARDGSPWAPPVDVAVRLAREELAGRQGTSIHDHGGMIQAAVSLDAALRRLVAALDAEVKA